MQYNDAHPKSGTENDGNKNKGTQFSLILNQAGVLGGDNRVFIAKGDGSTYWNWYNPDVKTENTWYHIMDVFYIKPMANLEMQGTVQYRKQNGKGSMAGSTNTWISAGVRPVYFFTKHFSVA